MTLTQLCTVGKDSMEHLFTDGMSGKVLTAWVAFCLCKIYGIPVIVLAAFIAMVLEFCIFWVKCWSLGQVNEVRVKKLLSIITAYIIVIVGGRMLDHVIGDLFTSFPGLQNIFVDHHSTTQLLSAFVFWAELVAILKHAKELGLPVPEFLIQKLEDGHDILNTWKIKT